MSHTVVSVFAQFKTYPHIHVKAASYLHCCLLPPVSSLSTVTCLCLVSSNMVLYRTRNLHQRCFRLQWRGRYSVWFGGSTINISRPGHHPYRPNRVSQPNVSALRPSYIYPAIRRPDSRKDCLILKSFRSHLVAAKMAYK